ncbi:macro domain-containing protein [Desulfovibrio aminophilus]|nr:macro domain-containing protein [Desulfovibrio aminophilus]
MRTRPKGHSGHSWSIGSGRLVLLAGDIALSDADAVVNAANSQLAGGGGVDGAIHRAAGWDLLHTACWAHIIENGEVPPGQAAVTSGFGLKAKWIIHAVGPVWHGGRSGEPDLLASAYRVSLRLAQELECRHVAFPALSCGAYGYPVELAAPVALAELRRGLEQGLVSEIRLTLFGQDNLDRWAALARTVLATNGEQPWT